jgi:hypothetical protein
MASGVSKISIVPPNRTPPASKQTKRVKKRKIETWNRSAIILSVDAGFVTSVNVRERLLRTVKSARSKFRRQMVDSNFKFYKQITDNDEFAEDFLGWLFERYCRAKAQLGEGEASGGKTER